MELLSISNEILTAILRDNDGFYFLFMEGDFLNKYYELSLNIQNTYLFIFHRSLKVTPNPKKN